MSDHQPAWVCFDCGSRWARRAPSPHGVSTYHEGDACGVCGKVTATTEPRDFGYLRQGWSGKGHGGREDE